jgi:hypothetical protein
MKNGTVEIVPFFCCFKFKISKSLFFHPKIFYFFVDDLSLFVLSQDADYVLTKTKKAGVLVLFL